MKTWKLQITHHFPKGNSGLPTPPFFGHVSSRSSFLGVFDLGHGDVPRWRPRVGKTWVKISRILPAWCLSCEDTPHISPTFSPTLDFHVSPWKGTILKGHFIWTNHHFQGDLLVFRGLTPWKESLAVSLALRLQRSFPQWVLAYL